MSQRGILTNSQGTIHLGVKGGINKVKLITFNLIIWPNMVVVVLSIMSSCRAVIRAYMPSTNQGSQHDTIWRISLLSNICTPCLHWLYTYLDCPVYHPAGHLCCNHFDSCNLIGQRKIEGTCDNLRVHSIDWNQKHPISTVLAQKGL